MHLDEKAIELYRVQTFRDLCPAVFPAGDLLGFESPDVILSEAGQARLGIEVTKYFRPTQEGSRPRQEQESLRRSIAEKAQLLFEGQGRPPLIVSLHFDPHVEIRKSEVDRIASNLVNLVLVNMPEAADGITVEASYPREPFLPPEISSVSIRVFPKLSQGQWGGPDAGYMESLTVDELQGVLNKKESSVLEYRQKVPEVWLLVVVEGFGISSTVSVSDGTVQHGYRSSFSRAFLLQVFEKRVWELRIR